MRNIVRTNVHLRLPKALHERAAEVAVEQDVSLNGLLVALIADKLGYDVVIPAVATQDEPSPTGGTTDPPEATAASLLDTVADAVAQLRALVVPEAT